MKFLDLSIFLTLFLLISCQPPNRHYDIIIHGGAVYDGTGAAPDILDLGIQGEKIIALGDLSSAKASKRIDATGLVVSPGFIDMHTHLDPIMRMPDAESHVRQGVTTALGGPDGGGPWPFGEYLDSLARMPLGMNVAYLVGHNKIRSNVMKLARRAPTKDELGKMKAQVALGMKEGAFGISTGLKYLPGAFSEVEEVIELSKVASKSGGIYTSHLREEGLGLIGGVKEAIQIADEANIPVILTHHKVVGQPMWGASKITTALVDSARSQGLEVAIDQYPYTASYTSISILIPAWCRAGGQDAFLERLKNPALKDSILKGIRFNMINDRGGNDLSRVQFARVSWMNELEGKTLKDWAKIKGISPTIEHGAELVLEAQANGGASCIFHAMNDEDVDRIMLHPQTMIASDGRLVRPGQGHPHPRWYGTFPRVLGHYVREKALMPLETAIYKMTALPAEKLGLTDRGKLQKGFIADIVIFDPDKIIDKATFTDPHQYSAGISWVMVNGQAVVEEGAFNEVRNGKVLRGPAYSVQ